MKKRKRTTTKAVQQMEDVKFVPKVDAVPETDDGPFDNDGLSLRQRAFVDAIVGPAAGVSSRAAQMAGYADSNRNTLDATASRTLRNAKVQEAISAALAKKRATPEWAKNRLIEIAASSMASVLDFDDKWHASVDFRKVCEMGALGQIKEFTADVLPGTDGKSEVIRCKIKVHDPIPALGIIMKLSGHLKDEAKIELTGPGGGPLQTETTHKFDYEQYRNLFARQRSPGRNGNGVAPANGN